ncbi:hypothetical protein ABBQ32_013310 [Trebouxia sp. C0010 RCD-2024]
MLALASDARKGLALEAQNADGTNEAVPGAQTNPAYEEEGTDGTTPMSTQSQGGCACFR